MPEAVFVAQFQALLPHLHPDLVLIAEHTDVRQAQRGEPVDTVILKTLAVDPLGPVGAWESDLLPKGSSRQTSSASARPRAHARGEPLRPHQLALWRDDPARSLCQATGLGFRFQASANIEHPMLAPQPDLAVDLKQPVNLAAYLQRQAEQRLGAPAIVDVRRGQPALIPAPERGPPPKRRSSPSTDRPKPSRSSRSLVRPSNWQTTNGCAPAVGCWPDVRRAALLATRGRRLLFIEPADPSDPLDLLPLHRTLAWTHLDEVRLFHPAARPPPQRQDRLPGAAGDGGAPLMHLGKRSVFPATRLMTDERTRGRRQSCGT